MKILNVGPYQVCEPIAEGVRVIMNHLGEPYSSVYLQGLSGVAFRIAGICPCAPTCSVMLWPDNLIRLLGYEFRSYDISSNPAEKIELMRQAVKNEIDLGRPALVWHAFTNAEWDVVCGYDESTASFLGRGSYLGHDDYASAPWDRAATAVEICPAFGAITIGKKVSELNVRDAEVATLVEAVRHGRDSCEPLTDGTWVMYQGIQCYRRWADDFSAKGKARDAGDAYCYNVYSSTHHAAAGFLREIAPHYDRAARLLLEAADFFALEAATLKQADRWLQWFSPWGIDEERSKEVAPILAKCANAYEQAIGSLELALPLL